MCASIIVCYRQKMIAAWLLIIITINVIQIHAVKNRNNDELSMHLLTSSNFTSYKLPVPGSDPITIIEANNRFPSYNNNNNDDSIENDEEAEATTLHHHHIQNKVHKLKDNNRNNFLNNKNRQQTHQKLHASIGLNVAEPESILKLSSTPHYNNADDHNNNDRRINETKKQQQNYSPMLLEKFIKEYSEKIKHTDESTKNELKNLEKISINNRLSPSINDRIDVNNNDDDEEEQRLEQKYWDDDISYNRRPPQSASNNNPYNDRDGWVTLDAVPWSTSKVSKWHPNKNSASSHSQNSFNSDYDHKPPVSNHWDDDTFSRPSQSHPPQPPPKPYYYNSAATESDDDYNNNYHDRYTTNKPIYTTYHSHQRPNYDQTTHSYKPSSSWQQQYDLQTSNYDKKPISYASRPRPHKYDYSHSSNSDIGSSAFNENYDVNSDTDDHWYDNNNRYKANKPKPFNEDILTEESISSSSHYPPNRRRPIREHNHPYSHPDDGDGEWVLISTTKGFQGPNRQGNRAISVQRFQPTTGTDTTQHQSVKLTVYPSTNKTFSYDTTSRRKPITLSHNGLLEVSPSFQSVDAAAEASNAFAIKTAGTKRNGTKTGTKRKMLKRVPLKAQQNSQDSSAVLAAVGAGMVPATVAMLMPMVLGRKKRDTKRVIDKFDEEELPVKWYSLI